MATETLRPDATGDENSIQYPTADPTTHWNLVDEATPDEGTTTIYTPSFTYERDLYNLPAHSIGSGTINSIKIYFRCRSQSGTGYVKPSLKSDSVVTDGSEITFTSSTFATNSQQWNTNPADSESWEWADIDALQIGVSLKKDTSFAMICTQVYVEVDYTAAPVDVTITVPLAAATSEGIVPTFVREDDIVVPLATVSATGLAPTMRIDRLFAVPLATASATGLVPTMRLDRIFSVPLATVEATGLTPTTVIIYDLFYGYIESITPHPDPASQDCYISAIDGLDFLARHELDTALYTDTLTGTIHGYILDSAGWAGGARTLDTGQDTVPFWYSSAVKARFAQNELDDSELSFSYVDGAGNFVFEDRHHRYTATHQTSQATFSDTMVDISYDYSARNVYNEVRATVTPWDLQSAAYLWNLEETPSIPAGETRVWWGDASVTGVPVFVGAWTNLVSGTDYIANSQADGGGDVETSNITLVTSKFAKSIKLSLTNDAAHIVYITTLKAKGTYYDSLTKVSRKSEDSTSQTAYQKRTLALEGKYLTDADKAQDFTDYGVARFKDPQAEVVITIVNKDETNLVQILTRRISDRITAVNAKLGLNADFFINKMEHEISEGGHRHLCRWYLVDASNEDFWCLDYSELGTGTKLGY